MRPEPGDLRISDGFFTVVLSRNLKAQRSGFAPAVACPLSQRWRLHGFATLRLVFRAIRGYVMTLPLPALAGFKSAHHPPRTPHLTQPYSAQPPAYPAHGTAAPALALPS
jgi:hypothetical protein